MNARVIYGTPVNMTYYTDKWLPADPAAIERIVVLAMAYAEADMLKETKDIGYNVWRVLRQQAYAAIYGEDNASSTISNEPQSGEISTCVNTPPCISTKKE